MSPEPSVWPAQDDHHSRSLAAAQPPREARPRRSRRKKDDEADLDRKDTKVTKPKEKEKDKDKDREKEKDKDKSREKDNNKENDKDKDGQEQKESKRGNRRQRDKSVSMSNAHSSTNSASHSRKKPKLEETPAEQRPSMPASTAPPAPIPAPTAAPAPPAPTTPAASPPAPLPAASLYHHHHYHHHQPPSHMQQGPRPSLQSSASLPSSAHPTPVQSVSYHSHTMAPVGPPPRPQSQPPPPPPTRTSGQNFDPIRSAFDTATPAPAPVSTPGPTSTFSPSARPPSPRPQFRASASPAIASIIDPPTNSSPPLYAPRSYVSPGRGNSAYSPSPAATPAIAPTPPPLFPPQARPVSPYAHRSPYPPQPQPQPQPQQPSHQSSPSNSSPPAQHAPMIPPAMPEPSQPASSNNQRAPSPEPTPMDVDADRSPPSAVATTPKKENKAPPTAPPTAPPSDPTSPKPPRAAKEAPSALPQGSGLISNALFGMGDGASTDDPSSQRTPSIILHIPLQGNGDRIVNFARLAEEQYGFAALHPRLAAHKERLARVAAAGAALERNDKIGRGVSAGESADEDLSLEMDRDSDLEGESALGPSAARANGPEATEGKKKRRRKKMEEYDRDDPFVDDSELAWQEQAAASKDGFFVYSGPLVPEGEKVQVERADGTIKRGRGRGRGGRGRGPPTTQHQVPLAAAVPISQETGLPLRGPGSRGGNPRRPRAKAARQQTEQDKPNGNGHTSHGRGGGVAGRGGSMSTRGGKTPSMVELAPRPNIATPLSGPGHELGTK